MKLPLLSAATTPLTQEITVLDERGLQRRIHIPVERPLTLFVDKRELVTLMTLGQAPELLVLGWLRNQRLIASAEEIESITVDWEVGAAAVRSRAGIADLDGKTAHRTVTTGCGQGTVFGSLMGELQGLQLPPGERLRQSRLYEMLAQVRAIDSVYKRAGSVHGCALFEGARLLMHVEDVGRHNAIDTIAGWMWMNAVAGAGKCFYTTGRLTSEMVIKSAQMGVSIIVSRNGITQMGHSLASQLGLTLIGRARQRHFICYSGQERFESEPEQSLS